MRQQIKLEEWSNSVPSYTLEELMPGNEEVLFKDLNGNTYLGEHWEGLGFEAKKGFTFEYPEITKWQPVKNDM